MFCISGSSSTVSNFQFFITALWKTAALVIWITGWILANGFWSTFFAIFFPPWAWYLTIEHALKLAGWL